MSTTLTRGFGREAAKPAEINRRLRTKYCAIEDVKVTDILEMHQVFTKYYVNADLGTFFRDLSKKDGAFVVRERASGRIKGFSTLKKMKISSRGRQVTGYFSGDTILEKDIWGGTQLHRVFARYMAKQKILNLGRPIYWFLISKGYKTYLLLANNFVDYYPRHDRAANDGLKELADAYCRELYPDNYDPRSGLLVFGDGAQHLQEDVAPITDDLRQRYPKIRFFEQCNPTWQQGTELPCVGEITMRTILGAFAKFTRKAFGRAMGVRRDAAGYQPQGGVQ